MQLPGYLLNTAILIRYADKLRELKLQLSETKDRDIRKKLQSNIKDIESIF